MRLREGICHAINKEDGNVRSIYKFHFGKYTEYVSSIQMR